MKQVALVTTKAQRVRPVRMTGAPTIRKWVMATPGQGPLSDCGDGEPGGVYADQAMQSRLIDSIIGQRRYCQQFCAVTRMGTLLQGLYNLMPSPLPDTLKTRSRKHPVLPKSLVDSGQN